MYSSQHTNMPSQMPSSFAAAAGQGSIRDSRNGAKCEIRGNGDWYVNMFYQHVHPLQSYCELQGTLYLPIGV